MRRVAVLLVSLVVLLVAGCGGGPSGSVMLATHAPASITPANLVGTASPKASPTATETQTWYTSAASNAKYYYCGPDGVEIAAKNRRDYSTEEELLAEWGGRRSKWPQSRCK